MWPRALVYILDSNFRVVFVQNFDTKRGNALSWEIRSMCVCRGGGGGRHVPQADTVEGGGGGAHVPQADTVGRGAHVPQADTVPMAMYMVLFYKGIF